MSPAVKSIELKRKARLLVVDFDDGKHLEISFMDLRTFSPSAENKAHPATPDPSIDIVSLHPVGNYAVRPVFSDGHESGIYSWDILHRWEERQ